MIEVENKAKEMANETIGRFWRNSIKDNPYKGKQGVVWHNSFYDECKAIGRSVK